MATKRKQKLVDGMRGLLSVARHDLIENTRGVKKDVQDLMVAARNTRRAVKDTKLSGLIELTNPDAGAEVLTHYKEEWGAIHSDAVDAAQVATRMDSRLENVNKSLAQSHSIITSCCDEFRLLPDTLKAFETAKEKVSEIGELLKKVEDSIMEYSRVKAQLETDRKREAVKIQFDKHKEQLELERQRLEGVLAEEHLLSERRQRELELQAVQERQQAFQEIFEQQMAEYREHGEVEKPIGSEDRTDAQLENVVIEDKDGTASLHEFLSDVVIEDLPSDQAQREGEGEGDEKGEGKEEDEEEKGESHDQSYHQKKDEEEEDVFHDAPEL